MPQSDARPGDGFADLGFGEFADGAPDHRTLDPGGHQRANDPDRENLLRRLEDVAVKLAPKVAAREHDGCARQRPKELFTPHAAGAGESETCARPENSRKNMERQGYDERELHDGFPEINIIDYTICIVNGQRDYADASLRQPDP
jgi:hypothetical protein